MYLRCCVNKQWWRMCKLRCLLHTPLLYYYLQLLEVVADNSQGIISPFACRLICANRIDWYINRSARGVAVEHLRTSRRWSCWLAINLLQRVAITKCKFSNRSNTIADCNTCQQVALLECTCTNRSNAVGNSNTCQRVATIECPIYNRSSAIGNYQISYQLII